MTHTPGPWKVYRDQVRTMDGDLIADCDWQELNTANANARLIAAAPDMLFELRTSLCPGDHGRIVQSCLDQGICGCSAGAAIAKATGALPVSTSPGG